MSFSRLVLAITTTLMLFAQIEPACAQGEVQPVDLVGPSAAVCLHIPQLESTWTKFQGSRLATRLREFPPAARFLSGAGFQKWMLVEEHVRRTTGNSLSKHLLGVFSQSVVVAIYLPEGKPPTGVLIAQARDSDALKTALQAWSSLDPQHVTRSLEHKGQAYLRRAKSAASTEVMYYTILGRTIALSDNERLIQQVIEHHAAGGVGLGPVYEKNKSRLPAESAAYLYINPRIWDRVVNDALGHSSDAAWIKPIYRQLAAISAALNLDDEVVLTLVVDTTGASVPSIWRQFVDGTQGEINWAQRIPASAVVAISSRLDFRPLIQIWQTLSSDAKTEDFARGRHALKSVLLGRDLVDDVLPRVLSNWTVALIPAAHPVAGGPPLDLTGRFEWPNDDATGNRLPALGRSLDQAALFGMTSFAAMTSHQRGSRDSTTVLVESESADDGTLRTLAGLKTWTPSILVTSSAALVATSRASLPSAPNESSATTRLSAFADRYFRSTSQLLWLDSTRLQQVLAVHGDWISRQVEPESADRQERVRKQLMKLEEVTRVFDAAFVAAGLNEDHIRVVVGAALDRSE
jgi:hypothetical protein